MRQRKRQPTNAEKVAPIFRRCACGAGHDGTRERFALVWNDSERMIGFQGFLCADIMPIVRESIAALSRENRPSALIRVIPRAEIIALADRIGEPVQ